MTLAKCPTSGCIGRISLSYICRHDTLYSDVWRGGFLQMIGQHGGRFIIANLYKLYSNFFTIIDEISSVFEIETILNLSLPSPNLYNDIKSISPLNYNEKLGIHTQLEYHKYNPRVLMCMISKPLLHCYFPDLALHG